MLTKTEIAIRLIVALIIGGAIGLEREGINSPAGFRTHILVCVGSALIMLTGFYSYNLYNSPTFIDPTRLGAQVVSGIGFIGAGTILKGGNSIKGLTTAASLWAVSGLGIACGAGFYEGAIITTVIILTALTLFFKIEKKIKKNNLEQTLRVEMKSEPGQIGKLGTVLGEHNVSIKQINIENIENDILTLKIVVSLNRRVSIEELLVVLNGMDFINSVGMYWPVTE